MPVIPHLSVSPNSTGCSWWLEERLLLILLLLALAFIPSFLPSFLPACLPACLPAFHRSFQLSSLRRVLFCSFFQQRAIRSDRTLITRVNCIIASSVYISRNDREHVATRLQQGINKPVMRWIMSIRRILHTSLFASKVIWPKVL